MGGIEEFGTQEQKDRFLPGMAKGKIIGCFGLTERTVFIPLVILLVELTSAYHSKPRL